MEGLPHPNLLKCCSEQTTKKDSRGDPITLTCFMRTITYITACVPKDDCSKSAVCILISNHSWLEDSRTDGFELATTRGWLTRAIAQYKDLLNLRPHIIQKDNKRIIIIKMICFIPTIIKITIS